MREWQGKGNYVLTCIVCRVETNRWRFLVSFEMTPETMRNYVRGKIFFFRFYPYNTYLSTNIRKLLAFLEIYLAGYRFIIFLLSLLFSIFFLHLFIISFYFILLFSFCLNVSYRNISGARDPVFYITRQMERKHLVSGNEIEILQVWTRD